MYYSQYKKKRKLLMKVFGVKIVIVKIILFQWFCPSIRNCIAKFRRSLEVELYFGSENLKSLFLPQHFLKELSPDFFKSSKPFEFREALL